MKVINNIRDMQLTADEIRADGNVIGFVPTMGALHKGHLSLFELARERSDALVVSIFVNPTQFGPGEDYKKYPRELDNDLKKCKELGVDIVFNPGVKDMYPDGFSTYVKVEKLGDKLCGLSRKTHFKGVTIVVLKLLNITKPHFVVFGQKDFQQAVIIKRMIEDLNIHTEILLSPTVREDDGLAMSSRNEYLSSSERKEAVIIYELLKLGEEMIKKGEIKSENIIKELQKLIINNSSGKIDYISIVEPETLEEVSVITDTILIAVAIYFGKTRLIDNILVEL